MSSPPLILTYLGIIPGAMPSTDRRIDAISAAPNGSAHESGALETPVDLRGSVANNKKRSRTAASTQSETAGTHDGDSPASDGNDDDEPFLPSRPLPLAPLTVHIHTRVRRFLDRPSTDARVRAAQEQARISLRVIREAISRYGLRALSLSFNGGKDCLVLLILYLAALGSTSTSDPHSAASEPATAPPRQLESVYIESAHPFPQVETFVRAACATYSLALARQPPGMKAGFAAYLRARPEVRAVLVGTRRSDPHGGSLSHFDETDHGWPRFMRVHPVIDWHYVDIWTFIRKLRIPYCPLYDLGYTSLGGTTDTHRNPALRRESITEAGVGQVEFRPAYELIEDREERLGRDREWKATTGSGLMHRVTGSVDDCAIADDDDTSGDDKTDS